MKKTAYTFASLFALLILAHAVSALIVTDIQTPVLSPGEEGRISLDIENDGSRAIEELSVSLDYAGLPFIPVGSSEMGIQKLNEDKEKTFLFLVRASPDAKPGDYKLPYSINAKNFTTKKGSLGIRVTGNSVLSFTMNADKPLIGERTKFTLKIINSGLTDAHFVSLKILPEGMTLLSEDHVYIGTINSDDFESASFDVIFTKEHPHITIFLTYKDFNNHDQTLTEELLPVVYTREKALELGIITKSNTFLYILIIVILFVLWLVWRSYKKRKRLKRSKELAAGR